MPDIKTQQQSFYSSFGLGTVTKMLIIVGEIVTFINRIQILANYMISDFPGQYEPPPGQKNIFYTAKTNTKYLFLYFENVF